MPFEPGIWTVNANGTLGTLQLTSPDMSGFFSGELALGLGVPVSGIWDELSQKVVFHAGRKAFTGFLFQDQLRMPGILGGTVWTFVGYFDDMGQIDPDKLSFGWYAQIGAN